MDPKIDILLKDIKTSLIKIKSNQSPSENFNIFTTLGVEILETRHSKFLAELLNPNGTHGCKDLFLKQFLLLKPIQEKMKNIDVSNFCTYAKVETEQFHMVEKNPSYIDIVIESKDTVIVIENKIYAPDQCKQLYRYYKAKKSESFTSIILVYLTLNGKIPDEQSLNNHFSINEIVLLSYNIHISDWIIGMIEHKEIEFESVKIILNQYLTTIENLTNKNSKKENMMIVDKLMEEDNLQTAIKIANALPRTKAIFEMKFYEKLQIKFQESLPNFNIYNADNYHSNCDEKHIDRIIKLRKPGPKKDNGFNGLYLYKELKNGKFLFLTIGEDNDYLLCCRCFLSKKKDIVKIQKIRKMDFKDTNWRVEDSNKIIIVGEDLPNVLFDKSDDIYLKNSEEINAIIEKICIIVSNEIQSDDFKNLENIMESN